MQPNIDTLTTDLTSDGDGRSRSVRSLIRTLVTGALCLIPLTSSAQSPVQIYGTSIEEIRAKRYGVDIANIGGFGRDTSRPNAVAIFASVDPSGAFENPGQAEFIQTLAKDYDVVVKEVGTKADLCAFLATVPDVSVLVVTAPFAREIA